MLRGEIATGAPGDPCCGVLDGISGQVSVPRSGLHLRVAQQFPDHRKALAERQRPRSIGVEVEEIMRRRGCADRDLWRRRKIVSQNLLGHEAGAESVSDLNAVCEAVS